jgi:hypothetical protein
MTGRWPVVINQPLMAEHRPDNADERYRAKYGADIGRGQEGWVQ